MALYRVELFKDGAQVHASDCRGTCTGVFQGGGYGTFRAYQFDTVTVEISCVDGLSDQFLTAISKTRLMQALVPGLEFINSRPYGEVRKVKWKFPGVGVLPCDQVISAMRIINAWSGGYFIKTAKTLREYELNTSEMLVLAMFGANHPKSSDSQPSLWYLDKAFAATPTFLNADRGVKVSIWENNKKAAYASMLLPLIRGEIQPGWQPLLQEGYMKEAAIVYSQAGDPYHAMPWWNRAPDTAFLTVNHPLIHPSAEGPVLDTRSSLTQVTEWVLTQLGK